MCWGFGFCWFTIGVAGRQVRLIPSFSFGSVTNFPYLVKLFLNTKYCILRPSNTQPGASLGGPLGPMKLVI